MRPLGITALVLLSIAVSGQSASGQSLSFTLFDRYLESFRVEAGIPGISYAILQDGVPVWERGLGQQDVDASVAATPDTPYAIGQLSQVLGASLLLRKCMDQSYAELTDPITRWTPSYPEPLTTIGQLLSHTSLLGGFRYAPERFAALTGVVEECADEPYGPLLTGEVFESLAMFDSVPGQRLETPEAASQYGLPRLTRLQNTLRRLAVPYRVVSRRPQRNPDYQGHAADASEGVVTTIRDLEKFNAALTSGLLLQPATRDLAWTQVFAGPVPMPTGLGWFVQGYNGQPIVWQFGVVDGAYSSLIVKVPNRGLTFIVLANSDGLTAPFALNAGDVTSSIFARLFLRTFVP